MNPTEQAARWLADVPRRMIEDGGDYLYHGKRTTYLPEAIALAAIARHLAPGDDLKLIADCELAAKVMADAGTFETGQSILREAAARIAALTAHNADLAAQNRDATKAIARMRDRLARMEGALAKYNAACADPNTGGWTGMHFVKSADLCAAWHHARSLRLTDGGSNG